AGDQNSVTAFWNDAARRHTPLVEPAADAQRVVVTFVWRGDPATQGVVLQAQLGHTRDPNENALTRLPNTDVWFRAYELRSDLRFTYDFQVRGASGATTARDPLNPRVAYDRSVVELPQAPPQPWVAARAGTPAGKVTQQDF